MHNHRYDSPKGMSLFVRRLSKGRHISPSAFAQRCKGGGLGWVALAGVWHDRKKSIFINKPEVIREYTEALTDVGIKVHIWGYPWHDRIDRFLDEMVQCTFPDTDGWLLDPELGFKGHLKKAEELVDKSLELSPYRIVGISSYGLPRHHKTFPFKEFSDLDYGCPQLYAMGRTRVFEGMGGYEEKGYVQIVPAFGVYEFVYNDGKRKAVSLSPKKLRDHLDCFFDCSVEFSGLIGWAENFMTSSLWNVLREYSERFDK